jgi:magnesium-transporting ATPase (P-type)
MKLYQNIFDYFSFFMTSNLVILAILKYSFLNDYQYPFLGLGLTTLPMSLVGIIFLLYGIRKYNGRNKMFYLRGWSYF